MGGSQVLLALVSTSALGLIPTLIGLWLLSARTLRGFREKAERDAAGMEASRALLISAGDREVLTTQVIPAFLDAGVRRTRSFFLDLIPSLDLSPEGIEAEEKFVNATAEDPELHRHEKIERLVFHFAGDGPSGEPPRAPTGPKDA